MSLVLGLAGVTKADDDGPEASLAKRDVIASVDAHRDELIELNQSIWRFAEVGLQETKSSQAIIAVLESAGFKATKGVADMPTAFVASYGSGRPIIGILAEYDALPELSQDAVSERKPLVSGAPGHGCGHSGLGTAAVGAAIAVKEAMEKHKLPGTIRLYGTPAEETLIGKTYMLLAGQMKDLDACLHWHPSDKNQSAFLSSKAAVSVKFTFSGTAAHASSSPDQGRSALDAVELMNIGVNYMREHVKEDARLHYVTTDGGGQPNVVPPRAQVWYYIRANKYEDVERYYDWVKDIAEAAAKMTRTKMQIQIETDNHEIMPNRPISELVQSNMDRIGAPTFTESEHAFARALQQPLEVEFKKKFEVPLREKIEPLPAQPDTEKGSTDVADVSWHVPTGGLKAVCFIADAPGHSWQNVATIGSPIGHKGTLFAAKVIAATAVDLLEDPKSLEAARRDFDERMKDKKYTTLIPKGQKAPKAIR
jgi:aminobenzoyl-glutamate utilization protein B